jgi:hypothetical protein
MRAEIGVPGGSAITFGPIANGNQTSVERPTLSPVKPDCAMPTIEYSVPFNASVRLSTSGACPIRRCQ